MKQDLDDVSEVFERQSFQGGHFAKKDGHALSNSNKQCLHVWLFKAVSVCRLAQSTRRSVAPGRRARKKKRRQRNPLQELHTETQTLTSLVHRRVSRISEYLQTFVLANMGCNDFWKVLLGNQKIIFTLFNTQEVGYTLAGSLGSSLPTILIRSKRLKR